MNSPRSIRWANCSTFPEMNKPWKIVLVLLGIFIAGGVTGAFVTLRVGRHLIANRPGPEQWARNHLERLVKRLDLKPEQAEVIRPIVNRHMEELSRLRNEQMTESRKVFEQMQQEISAQLTPEQRTKLEKFNKEMRERAKKFIQERKNRPREPRAGEPGKPDGTPPPPDKPPGG